MHHANRDVRDVVVIGAGPTGLALTIALRRYGIDTVVVDKRVSSRQEPRASVVWQRALEALRDLGCADGFMKEGLALAQGEFHVAGQRAGAQEMRMADTAFPGPLGIEQDSIEAILRERMRLLGPEVEWGTEAVAVRTDDGGAEVELRRADGRTRTVGCRWVVGAEGSHSLVRRAMGIPFEGERRVNLQCLQLNAEPDWSHPYRPEVTRIFINHGVTLIADPVPGATRLYAFCPDPDPSRQEPPTRAEMEDVVSRATGEKGVRLRPTEPYWANRARFHDRVAARFRSGPALLLGDSAHLWAPIGGRGLNTGLLGAHNLGWKLAAVHHGWCPDALLDTYNDEQRRTALRVMRHMRRNILELPPDRRTLTAIRLLLPHALRSQRFTRRGSELLSDFGKNHRGSALSVEGRSRGGGLRAGDRVPDWSVGSETGSGRLHGLLSYQRWSLLLTGDGDGTAGLRRLTERYALPVGLFRIRTDELPDGTLLLVRPDGHIGLRARAADRRALTAYLDRWSVQLKAK
ncbi:FAD-dependent monooxygenase [Streptomyces sp. AV19]|uniref:FAD-dependent monooxygenase n=1 Tax=Streptomyces sp. AV19 TaxID=2793068 RepID=UPI0018FE687C|nr:FAD-dependent monooxygenase [Streptomyces sp. AV19]MBH1934912.1 FAD-dependent monooxygenase [Streptomyces sp. AV19]MDG4537047.1 FAD-dependent monooxygenase [Streptomyces sp. AV19]